MQILRVTTFIGVNKDQIEGWLVCCGQLLEGFRSGADTNFDFMLDPGAFKIPARYLGMVRVNF